MPDPTAAKDWMRIAHMDLSSAEYLQGHRPLPIEIICYHCQQAAEKAIKAILAYYESDIPHIHDLGKLLAAAMQHEGSLRSLFPQAYRLTNYATFTRYPGDVEITEEDMKTALKYSEDILSQVEMHFANSSREQCTCQ